MDGKIRIFYVLGIIFLIILLISGAFLYFALAHRSKPLIYQQQDSSGSLLNPAEGLTTEQAIQQFNESFVFYLLYSIEAYGLHNPPLSSDTPKISFYIDSDEYNAEVQQGIIIVGKGKLENSNVDIIIKTSKESAVEMLMDLASIEKSFQTGTSRIELVADKTRLFSKGYLNLYTRLTGKGLTGNIIRLYAD